MPDCKHEDFAAFGPPCHGVFWCALCGAIRLPDKGVGSVWTLPGDATSAMVASIVETGESPQVAGAALRQIPFALADKWNAEDAEAKKTAADENKVPHLRLIPEEPPNSDDEDGVV